MSFQIRIVFGAKPGSGIAGSHGNTLFTFLRKLLTLLHSGCTSLHPHQQQRMIPFSARPLQHLFFGDFFFFFELGHSDGCEVIPHCSFDLHFFNNERC